MTETDVLEQSKLEMATALQLLEVAKMNLQNPFYPNVLLL